MPVTKSHNPPLRAKKTYPVRHATTGRHLFDGEFPFDAQFYCIAGVELAFHGGHWLASDDLSAADRKLFLRQVKTDNAKWLKKQGF